MERILRKQLRDNFDSIYNSHESSSSSGIQKNVSSGNETNSIGELPPDPGVSLDSKTFYEKTSDIIDHAKNRQLGETLQNYQRQLCLLRQRRIRRKLVNGVKSVFLNWKFQFGINVLFCNLVRTVLTYFDGLSIVSHVDAGGRNE